MTTHKDDKVSSTVQPVLPTDTAAPRLLRKTVYYGLTLLLTYGVLEVATWMAYTLVAEVPFSFEMFQGKRIHVINTPWESISPDSVAENRPGFLDFQVVHPFLGFVIDPTSARANINDHGFIGPPLPIDDTGGSSDIVIVAVLGGSVAQGLVAKAGETLSRELRLAKSFSHKEIFIADLAMGGMKQPQQLMIVNYFLSLGAHFDLVINLDGFNDIVLPVVESPVAASRKGREVTVIAS